jgi:hypothetical protein
VGKAKEIIVKVIPSKVANDFVRKNHYSGKVASTTNLHFGVFLNNILHGVLQFGRPLDKRKVLPLVKGTLWNEMLELNRLVFDEYLPRNSESRCLSIAFKLIKKNAPHIKWILSFADGTQCGDGTIYRASGFVLTAIKRNTGQIKLPSGEVVCKQVFTGGHYSTRNKLMRQRGYTSLKKYLDDYFTGWKVLKGFQLRYIYFIHKDEIKNLTCPIIPFSEIEKCGASMYKGQKRETSIDSDASAFQVGQGGASPTVSLQNF